VSDRIEVRGLRALGRHGVYEQERRDGQVFVVDLVLELDLEPAARSDDLADTVHYGELAERVAREVRDTRFDLLEALAGHLAAVCLEQPRVEAVSVRVAKPSAPVRVEHDEVAVVLRRGRSGRQQPGLR
jgi:dihydroneopterin aldolase